jgi:short-subunit dehydrogenase
MQELSGRTALVTGASKGLGLYIVRALIKERMNVVLSGVSENELSQATTSFSQSGVKLLSVITDLTDRTAVETLVTSAIEEFGAIDVLVNNAGVETFFAYHNLCLDQIEYVIRVNLLGTMILTRLVLPGMLKRGQGHIVNMSSLGRLVHHIANPMLRPKQESSRSRSLCVQNITRLVSGVPSFVQVSLRREYTSG